MKNRKIKSKIDLIKAILIDIFGNFVKMLVNFAFEEFLLLPLMSLVGLPLRYKTIVRKIIFDFFELYSVIYQ